MLNTSTHTGIYILNIHTYISMDSYIAITIKILNISININF